jgi:predicted AlkP superfamily pyrophosphatase or phosphodiesterase
MKFLALILLLTTTSYSMDKPRYEHVIFIGIDGLGAHNYKRVPSHMRPNLNYIKNNGAWSLKAKIDPRSFSGPNWMGMLTGSKSRHHGVKTNSCENGKGFPTIFEVIREQMPEAEIGLIYDWDSIGCYPQKSSLDLDLYMSHDGGFKTEEMGLEAARYIRESRPHFLFVYLGETDEQGHSHKGNSPEYNHAVEKSDKAIGHILSALKETKILEKTLIIITSDHGHGTRISAHTWALAPVPFFIMGPGVKKVEMRRGLFKNRLRNNMVSPLVVWSLGLDPAAQWQSSVEPLKQYFSQ